VLFLYSAIEINEISCVSFDLLFILIHFRVTMASSKYVSTKETTHAARLSRLLVDPCTDLYRDLLRNQITEVQFPHILQNKRSILGPILNKVQKDVLYPQLGYFQGSYAEFDLSLLYVLLRNISGIPSHRKGWAKPPYPSDRSTSANIDRIREIRNVYCGHAASVSLSDTKFHTIWHELSVIIGELEGGLPGGCTTYTDAAKLLKTGTMDPEQEKHYLDIIDSQTKSIDGMSDCGTIFLHFRKLQFLSFLWSFLLFRLFINLTENFSAYHYPPFYFQL
jgi:hypothetical protein